MRSLLDAAERDHPGMHAAHVIAALVFFALSGLSSSLATIGSIGLGAIWLLRVPSTMALNVALLRMPMTWLGIAWTAWASLGGLWTASPEQWRSQLGAWRVVLVIPATAQRCDEGTSGQIGIAGRISNVIGVSSGLALSAAPRLAGAASGTCQPSGARRDLDRGVAVLLLIAASAILPRQRRNWLAASMATWRLAGNRHRRGARRLSPSPRRRRDARRDRVELVAARRLRRYDAAGDGDRRRRALRPATSRSAEATGRTCADEPFKHHPRPAAPTTPSASARSGGAPPASVALHRCGARPRRLCGMDAARPEAWSRLRAPRRSSGVLGALKVEHPHSVALHAALRPRRSARGWPAPIAAGTLLGLRRLARDPLGCGILGAAILWIVAAQFESLTSTA
ncbi:MAG: hypothetical protein U0575_04460 [Phycisphaerales bacterium]